MEKKELIDLAIQFKKGDKEAFSQLYDLFADRLYKFIYFKVNLEDVEDITELTFLKAWTKKHTYNPKKSSISSWLYTIARNTVIDHYRTQKLVEELDIREADPKKVADPKQITEDGLNSSFLKTAINDLSKDYRDLVILRFIDDLSYKEIASILGKTEGSIRIMQFRAVRKLKAILEKKGFDSNNL